MIIKKIKDYLIYGNRLRNHFFQEHDYISQYLPENPIILEAGAHTGTDTLKMLYRWKHARIFSFEPTPLAYKKLANKALGYKNVSIFNHALGRENGETIMYTNHKYHGSSSLLKPKEICNVHPETNLTEKINVKVETIDTWAKTNHVSHIDFMWLDMQGYELEALEGAAEIFKTVCAVFIEVSFIENYQNNPLYPEMKKWFENKGFRVIKEEFEYPDCGNVFFYRKI